ncbi:uncharacterized protein ColSpa_00694 [Colletotrichum spaethianum]|uniref:Uncharacterized protein n=1 Tax=Colletotrichum spaethianum TaxID=700344 RepID=A0AA37L220_9PEZI|nr:uncharacterized protein ColSpa_00694 [Colletotrichum spaethianum]GKT40513.1 hypothetical protein ColSpa_00694 [Colletotrichum spaethianum]
MWQLSEILDALRLPPSADTTDRSISHRFVAGDAAAAEKTGPSPEGLGHHPKATDPDCLRIRDSQDTARTGLAVSRTIFSLAAEPQ